MMRTRLVLTTIALALVTPAVANASLASEQRQGQNLIAQLQTSTTPRSALSADDLDHIGEYVMFRALGSTRRHQVMNDRMRAMLGEAGESRMHQLLGARYAGCSTRGGVTGHGAGMMGGSGMMGGYAANGGIGAMMSSGDWSWMIAGAWQDMTRHAWQHREQRLLGPHAVSPSGYPYPNRAISRCIQGRSVSTRPNACGIAPS